MPRNRNPALEEKRRQLLTSTAYRLLARDSWQTVTLDRVAREAGVSKGLVTYYYASKDALLLETIGRHHALQARLLATLVQADLPLLEKIERLIGFVLPSRSTLAAELAVQTEIWSFAKGRPEVIAALEAAYRRFRDTCRALVAGEGGPSEMDFRMIHALFDGLSVQAVVDPELDLDALRAETRGRIGAWLQPSPARTEPRSRR